MKSAFFSIVLALILGSVTPVGRGSTLTDLHITDGNAILSQSGAGQLFADLSLGDPDQTLDCVFTLDAHDLQQDRGWGSFWFNILNASPKGWVGYRFEFFDPTFTRPFRVPLWAFSESPLEYLRDWGFQPDFNAHTIDLSGGTGVRPGKGFSVAAMFDLSRLIPPGSTEFSFGIRQSPALGAVPDRPNTLGLLAVALLSLAGSLLTAPRGRAGSN